MKKVAILAILVLCAGVIASAQNLSTPTPVTSNTQIITLNATVQEYLRIDAPSATMVKFDIDPMAFTPTFGDVKPAWNTNYSLRGGKTVAVCAYLGGDLVEENPSGLTAAKITMHNILGQPNSNGNYVAPGAACGQANGWVVDSKTVSGSFFAGTIGSSIGLEILDHVGGEPGTYKGTLNIVAQTI